MRRKVNDRNFELVFFPKHLDVNKKFEKKLTSTEGFEKEVRAILQNGRVTPSKVAITKEKSGRGGKSMSDMFEGFSYKKFRGKVRGEKKGLFSTKQWKSDFQLVLLSGKDRDGLLFRTEENDPKEMREFGRNIYARLLSSVSKEHIIPWSQITRVGEKAEQQPISF